MEPTTEEDQPLGEPVAFTGAAAPESSVLMGSYTVLRPLNPATDAERLYAMSHEPDGDPRIWTYLYEGPYASLEEYQRDLERFAATRDPLYFAATVGGHAEGVVSYLAIVPEHGSIEVGNIWFGRALQRTPAATEAIYLLAWNAFEELGYRRLEWKCNALHARSRRAAERLGFVYEGTFAQHRVVRGRNRDTAWFSITDARWPAVRAALEAWLAPENFDADGRQRRSLSELRAQLPSA